MKKRIKAFSKNVLWVALLLTVIYIGYVGFIGGPKRAYEKEDRLYVKEMMKTKGYEEARFVSRFSYDQVYYIAEILGGESKLVWFNRDFSEFGEREVIDLSHYDTVEMTLDVPNFRRSLGVYQGQIVVVFKNLEREVFIDPDSNEVLFDWKGVI